jgi:hypothetical protein
MSTCASGFSGWASDILDSLDETDITVGSATTWLRSNLGNLNLALGTSFSLDSGGCVSGIEQAHSGIYTEMYYCYYFRKKANSNLGVSAYDWTEIDGEDQGKIRKVSRNETSKTYMQLKKDCKEGLNSLVQWYHEVFNPNTPCQVLYNSRTDVTATALVCPPDSIYSPNNIVWGSY